MSFLLEKKPQGKKRLEENRLVARHGWKKYKNEAKR